MVTAAKAAGKGKGRAKDKDAKGQKNDAGGVRG